MNRRPLRDARKLAKRASQAPTAGARDALYTRLDLILGSQWPAEISALAKGSVPAGQGEKCEGDYDNLCH